MACNSTEIPVTLILSNSKNKNASSFSKFLNWRRGFLIQNLYTDSNTNLKEIHKYITQAIRGDNGFARIFLIHFTKTFLNNTIQPVKAQTIFAQIHRTSSELTSTIVLVINSNQSIANFQPEEEILQLNTFLIWTPFRSLEYKSVKLLVKDKTICLETILNFIKYKKEQEKDMNGFPAYTPEFGYGNEDTKFFREKSKTSWRGPDDRVGKYIAMGICSEKLNYTVSLWYPYQVHTEIYMVEGTYKIRGWNRKPFHLLPNIVPVLLETHHLYYCTEKIKFEESRLDIMFHAINKVVLAPLLVSIIIIAIIDRKKYTVLDLLSLFFDQPNVLENLVKKKNKNENRAGIHFIIITYAIGVFFLQNSYLSFLTGSLTAPLAPIPIQSYKELFAQGFNMFITYPDKGYRLEDFQRNNLNHTYYKTKFTGGTKKCSEGKKIFESSCVTWHPDEAVAESPKRWLEVDINQMKRANPSQFCASIKEPWRYENKVFASRGIAGDAVDSVLKRIEGAGIIGRWERDRMDLLYRWSRKFAKVDNVEGDPLRLERSLAGSLQMSAIVLAVTFIIGAIELVIMMYMKKGILWKSVKTLIQQGLQFVSCFKIRKLIIKPNFHKNTIKIAVG